MTETEFQRRVVEALEPLTSQLVAALRQLVAHEYPREVVRVDFEVFPDGFSSGFPVRAFFIDECNTEFFLYENGEARYPSPIDPGLLDIPRVYDASLEKELEEHSADSDSYTLAGHALIPWFAQCWLAAGGRQFPRQATIKLHDDLAAFDLVLEQWRAE